MTLSTINRTPSNVNLICQKVTEKKERNNDDDDENINQFLNVKTDIINLIE